MCGLMGVFGHEEAAALTVLGLHALQHRGQDAAGVVSYDGERFHSHRAFGLVGDRFNKGKVIKQLTGHSSVGHNRYATTGGVVMKNVQPLFAQWGQHGFALAHNGQLTNAARTRKELTQQGVIFQSTTDTEVIMHLMARQHTARLEDQLVGALRHIEGAYSLVVLGEDCVIGMRDVYGIRPLCLGRLEDGWLLASENCAFDMVGARHERDIEPGEMVVINETGAHFFKPFVKKEPAHCLFEYIYFARPDSDLDNDNIAVVRERCGVHVAREHPVDADIVIPVPDSGCAAAMGYANEANLPYVMGIIRNHYVGRTFIEPTDQIRNLGVRLKHNVNRQLVNGKRVVLVDDSLVRGTTSRKIVNLVRAAGATEVHLRVASPPVRHSCFYGIHTPTREELLAVRHESLEEMTQAIGADSLRFLSLQGLFDSVSNDKRFCHACLTGEYPIRLTDQDDKDETQLSLFQ